MTKINQRRRKRNRGVTDNNPGSMAAGMPQELPPAPVGRMQSTSDYKMSPVGYLNLVYKGTELLVNADALLELSPDKHARLNIDIAFIRANKHCDWMPKTTDLDDSLTEEEKEQIIQNFEYGGLTYQEYLEREDAIYVVRFHNALRMAQTVCKEDGVTLFVSSYGCVVSEKNGVTTTFSEKEIKDAVDIFMRREHKERPYKLDGFVRSQAIMVIAQMATSKAFRGIVKSSRFSNILLTMKSHQLAMELSKVQAVSGPEAMNSVKFERTEAKLNTLEPGDDFLVDMAGYDQVSTILKGRSMESKMVTANKTNLSYPPKAFHKLLARGSNLINSELISPKIVSQHALSSVLRSDGHSFVFSNMVEPNAQASFSVLSTVGSPEDLFDSLPLLEDDVDYSFVFDIPQLSKFLPRSYDSNVQFVMDLVSTFSSVGEVTIVMRLKDFDAKNSRGFSGNFAWLFIRDGYFVIEDLYPDPGVVFTTGWIETLYIQLRNFYKQSLKNVDGIATGSFDFDTVNSNLFNADDIVYVPIDVVDKELLDEARAPVGQFTAVPIQTVDAFSAGKSRRRGRKSKKLVPDMNMAGRSEVDSDDGEASSSVGDENSEEEEETNLVESDSEVIDSPDDDEEESDHLSEQEELDLFLEAFSSNTGYDSEEFANKVLQRAIKVLDTSFAVVKEGELVMFSTEFQTLSQIMLVTDGKPSRMVAELVILWNFFLMDDRTNQEHAVTVMQEMIDQFPHVPQEILFNLWINYNRVMDNYYVN